MSKKKHSEDFWDSLDYMYACEPELCDAYGVHGYEDLPVGWSWHIPYALEFFIDRNSNLVPIKTEDAEFEIVEPKLLEYDSKTK